jgi:hypothetical protein
MGYHTNFEGEFTFDRPVEAEQAAYIKKFSTTRRMKRDPAVCGGMADPDREAVGLPVGPDGCYFTGGLGFHGQDDDPSVVDGNTPPGQAPLGTRNRGGEIPEIRQPGLWCGWVVGDDQQSLVWNGREKFYSYVEWLEYLIHHFFIPWGYKLNGQVGWIGENEDDRRVITCQNNRVEAVKRYYF